MSHPVKEKSAPPGTETRAESAPGSAGRQAAARIAVDATGGDAPIRERISGAVAAARAYADSRILLCGPTDELHHMLEELGGAPGNLQVVDAPERIRMHESPVRALREKKRSSIAVGIDLVSKGEADAFVSAGNTGAVAAASTLKLGRLEGVQRPGIAAAMQLIDHVAVAIDVGANVDSKPGHLLQYGIMARVFAEGILGIDKPTVGLLNVGAEEAKGNELTKKAFDLLSKADLNFVGNVEPEVFFQQGCDILVCDGFVGNVLLKVGESLVMKLIDWLREQVGDSLRYKAGYLLCKDLFGHLKHCADYSEYGGAPLLGVDGITIITHGTSDSRAIQNAVREARSFVEHHVNQHIEEAILRDADRRDAGA
ncbi:MAG: phosphate acyltransferase PlsX [Planctomycetota bacterium]